MILWQWLSSCNFIAKQCHFSWKRLLMSPKKLWIWLHLLFNHPSEKTGSSVHNLLYILLLHFSLQTSRVPKAQLILIPVSNHLCKVCTLKWGEEEFVHLTDFYSLKKILLHFITYYELEAELFRYCLVVLLLINIYFFSAEKKHYLLYCSVYKKLYCSVLLKY